MNKQYIKGRVIDANGVSVEGARVFIPIAETDDAKSQTMTDYNGMFSLETNGEQDFGVQFMGASFWTDVNSLTKNGNIIQLNTSVNLDEFTVSAPRIHPEKSKDKSKWIYLGLGGLFLIIIAFFVWNSKQKKPLL